MYEEKQEARRREDFERFVSASPLKAEIEDDLMHEERLARNDPHWKPTGMLSGGGWAFNLKIRNLLLKHYARSSRE